MTTMYLHDTQHAFKCITTIYCHNCFTETMKRTKVVYTSENKVTKRHRRGKGGEEGEMEKKKCYKI